MLVQLVMLGGSLAVGLTFNHRIKKKQLTTSTSQCRIGLVQQGREGIRSVKKLINTATTGGTIRVQQLKQMGALGAQQIADPAAQKLEKNIKRSFVVMSVALAGSWFYAPLIPISAVGTLYIASPIFVSLFHKLKRGKITTELIEAVSVVGLLASGYFFLAAFITFTSLLSAQLLRRTEQRSQEQLVSSFLQKQENVWLLKQGSEVEVALEAVQLKDQLVVKAGESIPVDGLIIEGWASVDQHVLTEQTSD